MEYSFSKAICMHVTTYDNLTDRGDQFIPFINHILSTFLPYLSNKLLIEVGRKNRRSQRVDSTVPYSEKNMDKVFKMFLNRELESLLITDHYDWHNEDPYYDEDAPPAIYPPDFSLSLTCNRASNYPSKFQDKFIFPNEISFSLSDRVLGNHITHNVQQQFIDLFERALSFSGAVTGFITYETIAASSMMMTPFENYYKIDPVNKPGYRHHIRGYYWLNYLSELHVANLGGGDYIMKYAPCSSQKRWPSGIQLQLTADINNYSDDQLKELRAFLSPLFPPNLDQVTPLEFYGDPIHRLVE